MKKIDTKMNVAKKYEDKLESIEKDFDGLWAYTIDGYKFESMDTHTAHEFNQKDLYKVIQTIVPCDCNHCQRAAAENTEVVEEVAAEETIVDNGEPVASVTVRPAGKKFKYEADVNGEKFERLSAKDTYTHVVVAKWMNKENAEWFVYSYHNGIDQAFKQCNSLAPKTKKTKWIHNPAHTRVIEIQNA